MLTYRMTAGSAIDNKLWGGYRLSGIVGQAGLNSRKEIPVLHAGRCWLGQIGLLYYAQGSTS